MNHPLPQLQVTTYNYTTRTQLVVCLIENVHSPFVNRVLHGVNTTEECRIHIVKPFTRKPFGKGSIGSTVW